MDKILQTASDGATRNSLELVHREDVRLADFIRGRVEDRANADDLFRTFFYEVVDPFG